MYFRVSLAQGGRELWWLAAGCWLPIMGVIGEPDLSWSFGRWGRRALQAFKDLLGSMCALRAGGRIRGVHLASQKAMTAGAGGEGSLAGRLVQCRCSRATSCGS